MIYSLKKGWPVTSPSMGPTVGVEPKSRVQFVPQNYLHLHFLVENLKTSHWTDTWKTQGTNFRVEDTGFQSPPAQSGIPRLPLNGH